MKRNNIQLYFMVMLVALASLTSGCNLSKSLVQPNTNATQTAFSMLFTPVVNTPTPTLDPSAPSPTSAITYITPNPVTLTASVSTALPVSAMATPNPKPATYTLQAGEFPYCIARRFNVDPYELMTINNLNTGWWHIYQPGLVLSIPQTSRPFPAMRALHPHPATFTVNEYQMTVNKVACYYGDVEPTAIMQANGLPSPVLTFGQTLQIP